MIVLAVAEYGINETPMYNPQGPPLIGKSMFRIGGDSDLTSRGQHYSLALSYFFNQQPIPGLR